MYVSPATIWRMIGVNARMTNHNVRTGRWRAIVVNGRYRVDTDTVTNTKLGRYQNVLVTRDVPRWRALTGPISRYGLDACRASVDTLSPSDRVLLDRWLTRNHYI